MTTMAAHKIYDVTLTLSPDVLVWPGEPQVAIESIRSMAQGDSNNVSLLHICSHAATHVDAPRHFIRDAISIDAIAPEILVGPARLLQVPDARDIDHNLLNKLNLKGVKRLLFGTRNSSLLKQKLFESDYVSLTEDAARYLVDIGIKLVGIDYLSVEGYQKKGLPTHHILLEAGVVIVEGLDLTAVPPGDYELFCLPLKIKDGDGAPARVFLLEI